MKKSFFSAIFSVLLGVGVVAFAQQPQRPAPPQQERDREQQGQAQKITVTGCLAKATQANQYMITDKDSHDKYTFPGPAQLDTYVNQTVKLVGNMETSNTGEKMFRPESLSPVSPSC